MSQVRPPDRPSDRPSDRPTVRPVWGASSFFCMQVKSMVLSCVSQPKLVWS